MNAILLVSALCCVLTCAASDDSYFPVKTKTEIEGLTAFEAQWHGKSLERMNEPRLPKFAEDENAEVYRMMILPTWGNSIVVGVHKHGNLFSLSARRLSGQAGYDPGKLVASKDTELSADHSKTLEVLIQNLNFFQFPADDDVVGADGEEWIIEGVSQGKYHVAKRWCASDYDTRKRGLDGVSCLVQISGGQVLTFRPAQKQRPQTYLTDAANSSGVWAPCYNGKLRKGADLLPRTLIYCL